MNKVIEKGRLTNDPELKQTPNGVAVCSFRIAVKRPHVSETVDFFDCVAWRNLAEFISNNFHKGKEILIEGHLESRRYQDKNGNNRTVIEIVVEEAEFCGSKQAGTPVAPSYSEPNGSNHYEELANDDELPFK